MDAPSVDAPHTDRRNELPASSEPYRALADKNNGPYQSRVETYGPS
jgi:hypothetical protein